MPRLEREHGGRGGGVIPFYPDREDLTDLVKGVRVLRLGRDHGDRGGGVIPFQPATRSQDIGVMQVRVSGCEAKDASALFAGPTVPPCNATKIPVCCRERV